MYLKILKNSLFVFSLFLFIFPLVQAHFLPPVVNYLLDDSSTNTNSYFDSTVVPIPLNGAYHGVYTINDNPDRFTVAGRLAGIAEFEKSVYQTDTNSKRVALDRQFYRWNNFLRDDSIHPYLLATAELGRIPVASIASKLSDGSLLTCPDGSTKLAWPCIATGNFDAHIINIAQKIRDSGLNQFVLTFIHEPEDEIRCGVNDSCMGTAMDYIAAWRHIVTLFRQQNADNVDFMWIVRDNIFGETVPAGFPTADEIYPGDDYIDWIAADVYNFSFRSGPDFNWQPLSEIASDFYTWGSQRPKPLAFGEWVQEKSFLTQAKWGAQSSMAR